eukprot:jgi/Botrbrau1/1007/Bobra.114_1s0045.1
MTGSLPEAHVKVLNKGYKDAGAHPNPALEFVEIAIISSSGAESVQGTSFIVKQGSTLFLREMKDGHYRIAYVHKIMEVSAQLKLWIATFFYQWELSFRDEEPVPNEIFYCPFLQIVGMEQIWYPCEVFFLAADENPPVEEIETEKGVLLRVLPGFKCWRAVETKQATPVFLTKGTTTFYERQEKNDHGEIAVPDTYGTISDHQDSHR